MKIHLLSDIHLESSPYQIPADLDCDVIVAAGDIGVGTEGAEWLKTLEKPVIYVLGNHEYWTKKDAPVDMHTVLQNIKDAATGSNVHVLENEFIVINDVRFFGATFWTNLGKFNTTLIDEAHHMRNYVHIYCGALYENKNFLARFYQCIDRYCALDEIYDNSYRRHVQEQYIDTGRFHPFVGYLLNDISWKTIQEQILYGDPNSDTSFTKTVVLTHHHPSYQSLRLDGLTESEIYPTGVAAGNGRQPNGNIYVCGVKHRVLQIRLVRFYKDIIVILPLLYGRSTYQRTAPTQHVGNKGKKYCPRTCGQKVSSSPGFSIQIA